MGVPGASRGHHQRKAIELVGLLGCDNPGFDGVDQKHFVHSYVAREPRINGIIHEMIVIVMR